jgi:hypothetical protein
LQLSEVELGRKSYKILKEIAHAALLVPSCTQLIKRNGMNAAMKDTINGIIELQQKSLVQIATLTSMEQSQQCLIARIASISLRLMKGLLITHLDKIECLQEEYLHEVKPLITKAMKWAADEQLTLLDQHVNDLVSRHGILWARTRAIIVVAHAPNESLIEKSYLNNTFAHHLQSSPEEMRDHAVYTVECPPSLFGQIDIEKTLIQDFLAKSEFDKKVGKQVFDDSTRLFKDILAESAMETLDNLHDRNKISGCPMQTYK